MTDFDISSMRPTPDPIPGVPGPGGEGESVDGMQVALRRLSRRYWLTMSGGILPLIIGLAIFLWYHAGQEQARTRAQVETDVLQLSRRIDDAVKGVSQYAGQAQSWAEAALRKPEWYLGDSLLRAVGLTRVSTGAAARTLDDIGGDDGLIGNVYLGDGFSLERRAVELRVALGLFAVQRAAHRAKPYLRWSSYYSARGDLFTVYPFLSLSDLMANSGTDSVPELLEAVYRVLVSPEGMDLVGPARNPSRTDFWTAPYVDVAGAGMMVTLLAPVYDGDTFMGVVGTDVLLGFLSHILEEAELPPGELLIVDQRGNVLGDNYGRSATADSLLKAGAVLSVDLSHDLADTTVHEARSGRQLFTSPIEGAPWHLAYATTDRSLFATTFPSFSGYLVLGLAVLSVLLLAWVLMIRFFARPALGIARFVSAMESGSSPGPVVVPGPWGEWFTRLRVAIRERNDYLRRLRNQRAYLDELIEGAPEAIVVLDPHDRIVRVNQEFTRLFGYRREEALGRKIDQLIIGRDRQEEGERYASEVREGRRVSRESVRRRKDGSTVQVSVLGVPVSVGGGQVGTYAIYRDISEQKALEEQLLQAQKMEAVGRLAGGIAHDFNNLLTAILGYVDLCRMQIGEIPALDEDLQEIRRAALRASDLTRQLLTFARKDVASPRVLDLGELVVGLESMLHRLIGETVSVETRCDSPAWPIKADSGQIEQVILNLVVNAKDALGGGGRIEIEVRNEVVDDEAFLRGHSGVAGRYVRLSVIDDGEGISPEVMDRMFEPFFTTKELGKGTGLGLATCYGIVRQVGGFIAVDSTPSVGSTFAVYFPVTEEQPAYHEDLDQAVAPDRPRRRGSVLLVEDEELVRSLAERVLRGAGYSVIVARDGEEALALVREDGLRPDLLLTDVVLPHIRGPEVAHRIRADLPGTKVLYMSGYADDAALGERGVAAQPFLNKPFAPAELRQAVAAALGD